MLGDPKQYYDVVIMGTGMSGTILGTILARHGIDVLLLDSDVHPRFTIGESTIPHTSLLLAILAEKYGVPELEYLAFPNQIADHICNSCGIKRSFGFAYQRPGKDYDPREAILFGTSSKDENHLFRQDIDAYLMHLSVRYGAHVSQRTKIGRVALDADGVRVETDVLGTIHCRYVIDASGIKSILGEQYGLRETPTRLQHHSRMMFTHMIGVKPFNESSNPLTLSWSQSTLHHVFHGGWIWVIPFNNYARSRNPLVSVGMLLDPRVHPVAGLDPHEEFKAFLKRFPTVHEQFSDARVIRPWVASSHRIQYSSTQTVGPRYCLMAHAAGLVDALYSRGLINTMEVVTALIDPLMQALKDNEFSMERFAHIDVLQQRVLDYNDRLVAGSYASWADFDLWNAWLRVWAMGTIITEFRVMAALQDFTATRDEAHLRGQVFDPLFSIYEDPNYKEFFNRAEAELTKFQGGAMSAKQASDTIFEITKDYEFPVHIRVDAMRRAGWMREQDDMSERSLRFARQGFRWALTNPTSRDLFGNPDTLYRWRAKLPDPHLI